MTVYIPESVSTLANSKFIFVKTVADLEAPTLAEVTDAPPNALDITSAIYGDVWNPTQSPNRATSRRRASEREQRERLLSVTNGLPDLNYGSNPQAAPGSPSAKIEETLTEGLEGLVFWFAGISGDPEVELELGDRANIYPVRLGPQLDQNPTDESGEFGIVQPIDLTGPILRRVALVAGTP